MLQKDLFINMLIRIILIIICCFLLILFISKLEDEYYFVSVGTTFIILLQIYLIVKFVNKNNRDLSNFISGIEYHDSTIYFNTDDKRKNFRELNRAFNKMNEIINRVKKEKVRDNLYLQNVINHIGIGIISFNENYDIELFNNAAKKILQVSHLKNIDSLDKIYEGLSLGVKKLIPDKPKLFKIIINKEVLQLSLKLNVFKAESKIIKLITLQNIVNELERNELESWQKLIRVLTHEIMNSVSPITSLSTTISRYYKKADLNSIKSVEEIDNSTIEDTLEGLNTIEETGKNLINFVTNYRSLTTLALPKMEEFEISELFSRVILLINEKIKSEKINIHSEIEPEELTLLADEKQAEQILLNLIQNSINALQNIREKQIILKASRNNNERVFIEVIDNGMGIPAENINNIFIPFYSTKENGSGIGLSLSRQVMNLHKGNISVSSVPGEKTSVLLIF